MLDCPASRSPWCACVARASERTGSSLRVKMSTPGPGVPAERLLVLPAKRPKHMPNVHGAPLSGGYEESRSWAQEVANVLVTEAFGPGFPGFPEPIPARRAADSGLAALIGRTNWRSLKDSFTLAYPLIRYIDCKPLFEPGGRVPRPVSRSRLPPPCGMLLVDPWLGNSSLARCRHRLLAALYRLDRSVEK